MFSPYYAAARRRGTTDPQNYCALNVALYGKRKHWAMTERGRRSITRDATSFTIGPSALSWQDDALVIDIDEITVPFPSRFRGRVRVYPHAVTERAYALDDNCDHHWWPIAPSARVEVDLQSHALRWRGDGYLDSNFGKVPLEQSFISWDWSRAPLGDGAAVLYDVTRRDGSTQALALRFNAAAHAEDIAPPPGTSLKASKWQVRRNTRADNGEACVIKTLEDAPFYARSLISTRLLGQDTIGVHESLSLNRFANRAVQWMLPFRMPRAFL